MAQDRLAASAIIRCIKIMTLADDAVCILRMVRGRLRKKHE
jgi:hypothetical protein